jgi:hypothetical protein
MNCICLQCNNSTILVSVSTSCLYVQNIFNTNRKNFVILTNNHKGEAYLMYVCTPRSNTTVHCFIEDFRMNTTHKGSGAVFADRKTVDNYYKVIATEFT